MAHRIRPGLLHSRPLLDFGIFPAVEDREKIRFSTKVRAASILLSIWTAPLTLTALIVILAKPDGSLSSNHNTVFWLGSSIALGFAVVIGSASVAWFFRYMTQQWERICIRSLTPLVRTNQQQFLNEVEEEFVWLNGEDYPERTAQ